MISWFRLKAEGLLPSEKDAIPIKNYTSFITLPLFSLKSPPSTLFLAEKHTLYSVLSPNDKILWYPISDEVIMQFLNTQWQRFYGELSLHSVSPDTNEHIHTLFQNSLKLCCFLSSVPFSLRNECNIYEGWKDEINSSMQIREIFGNDIVKFSSRNRNEENHSKNEDELFLEEIDNEMTESQYNSLDKIISNPQYLKSMGEKWKK
jgi:hypothetical protein